MRSRLVGLGVLLVVVQVIHGAVPTGREDADGSWVGLVGGLLLLVAAIVATVAIVQHRDWGRRLLALTGAVVAVGFVLYHAIPVTGPLTNPYWGGDVEPVSGAAWATVVVSVAVGAWAAWEASRAETRAAVA